MTQTQIKTVAAFAPVTPIGHLWTIYIGQYAREVRRDVGLVFVRLGSAANADAGWKYAKKNGYRVIRVRIVPEVEQ